MADSKLSALATLATSAIAAGDLIPIVDVSDTSMAASGTNKVIAATEVLTSGRTAEQTLAGDLSTAGQIILANNKMIRCKDSGGTAQAMLYLTAANVLDFGRGVPSGQYINFTPGGSSRMVILAANGYVGILKSNPAYPLEVNGDINAIGSVRANGTPLTSDERLKDHIETLPDALAKVMQARGVTFAWKGEEKDTPKHTGFVAQEIEALFPDLVSEWNMNGETIKCVDYSRMVPVLLEAIKTLASQVNALAAAVKA